jgi:hypothetical protein
VHRLLALWLHPGRILHHASHADAKHPREAQPRGFLHGGYAQVVLLHVLLSGSVREGEQGTRRGEDGDEAVCQRGYGYDCPAVESGRRRSAHGGNGREMR